MVDRRNSVQKRVIAETLAVMDHPTASEVYDQIHGAYPQISLGTVYRNLGTLADDGAAVRLSFAGEADRFDPNTYAHSHAICKGCGALFDVSVSIDTDLLDSLDREVERTTGIKVQQHNLVFEGLCARCQ
jgi:Fur family peroxide stress response transcriptional regulator